MKKKLEEKMGGPGSETGINRMKKTPEEIAAEQAAANQDDFTSECCCVPKLPMRFLTVNLNLFPAELKNSIETQVSDIKGQIEEKCHIQ